jgi:hypothetical protein
MPRTTVDIDAPILRDLKKLQRREGKSLGRLISDLLATALAREPDEPRAPFRWTSKEMGARIDVTDKDAVYSILDREHLARAGDEK